MIDYNASIENLIGNVYQSILGSHNEKCRIIGGWLDDYVKYRSFVPPNEVDSSKMVDIVTSNKKYRAHD
jgi:hypothetical protein